MSNISINPALGSITVQVACRTPQVVSFSVTIFQSDGNTVAEYYTGNTQTTNPFQVILPQSSASYQGDYVACTLKLFDPAGAGNPYDIEVAIIQNGTVITPATSLQGNTVAGVNSFQALFHLQ